MVPLRYVPVDFETESAAGQDWVWREDRIQGLLSTGDTDVLFPSGYAANEAAMLDKQFILSEIKRTANGRNGKPSG